MAERSLRGMDIGKDCRLVSGCFISYKKGVRHMQRALVIIGGKRVGDNFHLIPFFESIKDKEITWVTGTYERQASELIQWMYPNIKELVIKDDGFPGNMNDCKRFVDNFWTENNREELEKEFDDIYDDPTVSFDWSPLYWVLKDNYFHVKKTEGDYIVYHLDTVSDWKRHYQIRGLDIDYKGYSLGSKNDFVLPGTIDFTNQPLTEVVKLIAGAKMFVGIHSAMTCLNFFINKTPSIVVHPQENLLRFSDYREGWIDLVKPTSEELKKAIEERL